MMAEAAADNLPPNSAEKPGHLSYTALEKGADALLALIEEEKAKATAESSSLILELENRCTTLKNNFSKLESVAKTVNAALGKTKARCRELTEESQRAKNDLAATREELTALKDKLNSQHATEKKTNKDFTRFLTFVQPRMGFAWDGNNVTLHDSWKRHSLGTISTCFGVFIRKIERVYGTQDGRSPFPITPRLLPDTGQPTSEGSHGGFEESMNIENQQHSMQGTCAEIQELSQTVPSPNLVQTSIGHDETSKGENVSNELHVLDQVVDKSNGIDKTDEIACPSKDSAPSSEFSFLWPVCDREASSRWRSRIAPFICTII
jgi:hypothetical protein